MSTKGVEEAIKGRGVPIHVASRMGDTTRGMGFERRRVGVKKADGVESRSRERIGACVCVCARAQVARRLKVNGHKWFRNLDGL